MPRLLNYVGPSYAWLAAIDPSLPRALFVALVFLTVLAWRKLSPGSWLKFSSFIPLTDADTSWFKATLLKVWQALPSAALGAVYGALGTGGNVAASVKLALLALLAPVIHELAWRYEGALGKPKPPSGDAQPAAPVHVVFSNPREPDEPPAAAISKWRHPAWRVALVCLVIAGCARLAKVDWSQVTNCAEQPAESALTKLVSDVLAGTGDVKTELEGAATEYGPGVVKCAVQQFLDQLDAAPRTARVSRQAARGRAFLAKVQQ